jgi:uncharacterized SAM-binding protein YcdF (DUF218 family)
MYLLRTPLLCFAGTWLDVGERPTGHSDYVLVLNGDANTRPFAAAALVKAGLTGKVILTTCVVYPDEEDGLVLPTHEATRRVLLKRGVRAEDIVLLDRQVDSTFDEARALADFLQTRPDTRVIVVTNAFHTRRARWIFANILGPRAAQLTFVSAPLEDLPLDRWWTTWVGIETVPAEHLRMAYYLFRYSTTPWLVVGAVLVVVAGWGYRRRRTLRRAPV